MIKNVIFDIGNVILYFDINEYLKKFTDSEEEREYLRKNVYKTPEWDGGLCDLGYMERSEAINIQLERTNHERDELILRFWGSFMNDYVFDERVIELIKSLKTKGYKLYILSNFSKDVHEHFIDHELFKIVDGAILSYQVHTIKPNDEIYHELEKQFNINFAESIFIDNNQDNVDKGNALGLKSIKVNNNDYEDLLNKIGEYID